MQTQRQQARKSNSNPPSKNIAKTLQKQVRIEDVTHETDTAMNIAPMVAKKIKEKYKTKYQQIYTDNQEDDKRAGRYKKKKKTKSWTDWALTKKTLWNG